jgi:hypothetical protein
LRSSSAAIRGSVVSTGSSRFGFLASGLLTSSTLSPIFNMTEAPVAIGSSSTPRRAYPVLDRPPISITGTVIAIPVGADFEFFIGLGEAFGVSCFGLFDPKFQNE